MEDVERGQYSSYDSEDQHEPKGEDVALLSEIAVVEEKKPSSKNWLTSPKFTFLHLFLSFLVGVIGCLAVQYAFSFNNTHADAKNALDVAIQANPSAGSTESHQFPPPSPTNAFPSMFPTNVGYAGSTPTGAEAALIATMPENAYPMHTGAPGLVKPDVHKHKKWDLFKQWGNLSPWYSNARGTFGLDSDPEVPDSCRVTGLHLLHRHGARYPTAWASYGGPAEFATKLHQAADQWTAKGDLAFLNDWTYKLGAELLTPFGRQQLYDLGISTRLKYGFLLKNFTETNTIPVWRTESQNRMLNSALNFAIGFFGYPLEGQYEQSITIEADNFNNTLAPYMTCKNARNYPISYRGDWYVKRWAAIYLKKTRKRIQSMIDGIELTIEEVFMMQQTCAYETVALGYSAFCPLFTQSEWEGFDYALDLSFWYNSAFGSPVARVQGAGWVRELVARLEHRLPTEYNDGLFSVNRTLDGNDVTFPVNQSLYVDATHEVVVLNILTALNLSTLAANGPLPYDHIPKNQTFKSSQLSPFATNVQFQLLSCSSEPLQSTGDQIRIIINDAPVPLTGIKGCPKQKDGMCPVSTFVKAQKEILAETSWDWDCNGDWEDIVKIGEGEEGSKWETVTGDAPRPKKKGN